MQNSGALQVAVAALVLMSAGAGCATDPATASVGGSPDAPVEARRGTFRTRLLLTGELEAVHSERIMVPRTPVWQLPIRWMEQDGVEVVQGQKVLELDNSQFTGDLSQKRLSRSSAANDMARKEAELSGTLAERAFNLEARRIELEKARIKASVPENLRSQREYQEDQLALARAEVEYVKAQEDLRTTQEAAEAELEELRVALERTEEEIETAEKAIEALSITAPRDGLLVVSENRGEGRKFQIGDNVWVGLSVMRIPDLSSMKVVADLSDVDDGLVERGMRARCTLDTYPDQVFEGVIDEIAPIAQEESNSSMRRSFRVVILLDRSDPERMRPGMSVKVEVLPDPIEDVLLVPRAAVDFTVDPPRVRLADGSGADVQLGECSPTQCVVEGGLQEGVRLRAAL